MASLEPSEAPLGPTNVAKKTCGGAHRIGRQHGHAPPWMSPLGVRPYARVQKNDGRNAEAITETAVRPTTRFIAVSSAQRLDLEALQRARERPVTDSIRLIDQGRGYLMEHGLRVGTGRHVFHTELTKLPAEDAAGPSQCIVRMLFDMASEPET
jgi:transposase